jgi:hypothetical protein
MVPVAGRPGCGWPRGHAAPAGRVRQAGRCGDDRGVFHDVLWYAAEGAPLGRSQQRARCDGRQRGPPSVGRVALAGPAGHGPVPLPEGDVPPGEHLAVAGRIDWSRASAGAARAHAFDVRGVLVADHDQRRRARARSPRRSAPGRPATRSRRPPRARRRGGPLAGCAGGFVLQVASEAPDEDPAVRIFRLPRRDEVDGALVLSAHWFRPLASPFDPL